MEQILCFGDSITLGMWDSGGGWVQRLRKEIDKRAIDSNYVEWHAIFNVGIDGDETKHLLKRFNSEATARRGANPLVIIFSIGINDCYVLPDGTEASTPEQYTEDLNQLTQQAREFTSNIIFLELTGVDESKTNPLPSSATGKLYANEQITKFNQVLRQHCQTEQLPLVELPELNQGDFTRLLPDGLHPNDEGHELIYQRVRAAVMPLLGR